MNSMTVEWAVNLSDFYQLMAIGLRYPTRELAEGLREGTYETDAAGCLTDLGESKDAADALSGALLSAAQRDADTAESLFEKMRIAYTGLFLIPERERVFIYESRFCYPKEADPKDYSMFLSPCALHVEQMYREAGVQVRKGLQEPPDHMATELEFLSWLYRKLAEALNGAEEKAELWSWRIREFQEKHLGRWYDAFLQQVEEKSELETYQRLAKLGRALNRV